MGVYLIQQCDEMAQLQDFSYKQALQDGENKRISIKKNPDGVEVEAVCSLKYKDITFNISSKMNPGTDSFQQQNVWVRSKSDKSLSKICFSKAVHPHESIGVFLEHSDGTVEKIKDCEPKTSYAYQAEMCDQILKDLKEGKQISIPSKYFTLDYSIYLLEVVDALKTM